MKQENIRPTNSELQILQVIWKHGSCTVRFVNDVLNKSSKEVRYTSTLKLMQIMVEKNLLLRDESNMKHVYSAAVAEEKVKSLLLDRFLISLYGGSPSKLMMQILGNKNTSQKEIELIKTMIKEKRL